MLPTRQSSRTSAPPTRLGFEKFDTPLPTIKNQDTPEPMANDTLPPGAVSFTVEQEAIIDQRIAAAIASAIKTALATQSPSVPRPTLTPEPERSPRSMTADL